MSGEKIKPESVIVYLDLVGDVISKRNITKLFQKFAEDKLDVNPQTTFAVLLFENDGIPFFIEETNNIKEIVNQISKHWKERNESSFLENGLMYCLSVHASKAKTHSGTFRILVISDLPSNANSELEDAILNLVEVVRNFPTFIDVIRIGGERFYKDDVKLRIITTTTSGGLFYGENEKDLLSILKGLARNKKMPDLLPEGGQIIDEMHKPYYEGLASTLIELENKGPICSICQEPFCNFCNNTGDIPKGCPQCMIPYHECCAALYSFKNNIGLKHIFRCKNCGILLKLDESMVYSVNNEVPPSEPIYDKHVVSELFGDEDEEEEDYEIETETEEVFDIKSADSFTLEEPEVNEPPIQNAPLRESTTKDGKKIKYVRTMFGVRPVLDEDGSVDLSADDSPGDQQMMRDNSENPEESDEDESDAVSSLIAKRRQRKRKQRSGGVKICSFCSSYLKGTEKVCPKCQNPIW